MLYISISYRILSSLANNPDTVEDMYCYGCRMLGPCETHSASICGTSIWSSQRWLWNIGLVRESARASGFLSFYFKD